jgi:hypothetical protein
MPAQALCRHQINPPGQKHFQVIHEFQVGVKVFAASPQRLRSLLLDPSHDQRRVTELMVSAGLIASGVTSADYRNWCGESPSQTRLRRLGRDRNPANET